MPSFMGSIEKALRAQYRSSNPAEAGDSKRPHHPEEIQWTISEDRQTTLGTVDDNAIRLVSELNPKERSRFGFARRSEYQNSHILRLTRDGVTEPVLRANTMASGMNQTMDFLNHGPR